MKIVQRHFICRLLAAMLLAQPFVSNDFLAQSGESLRILVLPLREATYPIVQVQDQRGFPIAGAEVTFRLSPDSQRASFGQGRLFLTTKTDTQGLASARTLEVSSGEAVQIQLEAKHQDRTATASMTQVFPVTKRSQRKWLFIAIAAGTAAGVAVGKSRSSNPPQSPATVLGVGGINVGRP